jgi:hypothetical protein
VRAECVVVVGGVVVLTASSEQRAKRRGTCRGVWCQLLVLWSVDSGVSCWHATVPHISNFLLTNRFDAYTAVPARPACACLAIRFLSRRTGLVGCGLTAFCMWLMWICTYLHQWKPLIKPLVSEE